VPSSDSTAPARQLIGSGRTADVYALGDSQVLRRYRAPRDTKLEVAAMEHARSQGFPVPAAQALNATDIAMDRVEGPTMLADLGRRPWVAPARAATLAWLHERLHALAAPAWLPAPLGDGDSFLHLDLHPDNVIIGPRGPMVIDWPNAARGPAEADVAHTWIILACAAVPGGRASRSVAVLGRRGFLRLFLGHFDRAEVARWIPAVGTFRIRSRVLPEPELELVERLVERAAAG
jgi:aminoglycoside phosphotransferase (APT) family kinase protein